MTGEELLDLEMIDRNDAGASTIREYLKSLLLRVWRDEENFSGKRPFGNSGWQYEVYKSILGIAYIPSSFTNVDDYDITYEDTEVMDELILEAIESL